MYLKNILRQDEFELITGLHQNDPDKNVSFAEILKTEVKMGGGGGVEAVDHDNGKPTQ